MKINKKEIRKFYKRLNHKQWGVSEVVALAPHSHRVVATGFFTDEDRFVSACYAYGGGCEIYAGVQPRKPSVSGSMNLMNIVDKKQGDVLDIQYITGVCFNVVQIKEDYQEYSKTKHKTALNFVRTLQCSFGGDIDDMGDAIALWIPFVTPIRLTRENRTKAKIQMNKWREWVKQRHYIESMRLGYDFKVGFTDLQRITGSYNHGAKSVTRMIRCEGVSDRIRNQILSIDNELRGPKFRRFYQSTFPDPPLPAEFKKLLGWNATLKALWTKEDVDTSPEQRDWELGQKCIESGIDNAKHLQAILKSYPQGQYQMSYDNNYVQNMVTNLLARVKKKDRQLPL